MEFNNDLLICTSFSFPGSGNANIYDTKTQIIFQKIWKGYRIVSSPLIQTDMRHQYNIVSFDDAQILNSNLF